MNIPSQSQSQSQSQSHLRWTITPKGKNPAHIGHQSFTRMDQ